MIPRERKRNFSIVAHIDHGKSTIADRLLEHTQTLKLRKKVDRYLDKMDLEKEKGITIKAQTVRMFYEYKGDIYQINLIDTPGHVDFSYEVSRSLASCEGALLVVDAAQGVQAQTLANTYLALDNDLSIIPVLNKIDLPSADVEGVKQEIQEVIGLEADDAVLVSAKDGRGMEDLLQRIVEVVPPPKGDTEQPLRGLIFDSWFDSYVGVVSLIRVFEGEITPGMSIKMLATGKDFLVERLGVFGPEEQAVETLRPGDVGFFTASIKDIKEVRIGDTVTGSANPAEEAWPGFVDTKPMVYCGIFPVDSSDYPVLRDALAKLSLNDSSFSYEPENSPALGFGYRCGFLGGLHMEIYPRKIRARIWPSSGVYGAKCTVSG